MIVIGEMIESTRITIIAGLVEIINTPLIRRK